MKLLAKQLKPYLGLVLLAIALLFLQAMADLALPDYMSKIVNVGIQQGGIENAVPEAISQSKMKKLTLFIGENNQNKVMDNYTLIDKSSAEYQSLLEKYPILTEQPIYVLKAISDKEINQLNPIMGKAFIAVSGVEKLRAEAKDGFITFNSNKVPADTDLFLLFANLSEEQRLEITEEMNKHLTALGDQMVVQGAVGAIRAEYGAIGTDTEKIQNDYIIGTGIIMLLISLASAVCIVGVGFFASKTAAGFARDLRNSVFTKVESFSKAELDKFSTASLITRTTNDITQIQTLTVIIIRMVFYAPIMAIGGVTKALSKSPSMSWIIAVAVIAIVALIAGVFINALPKFRIIQRLIDRLNLVTRENLSGIMVIRAFNTQKFEVNRFDQANRDLTSTNLFVNRIMVVMFPTMMLIMNGITLLIVWVGAQEIANSSMQVGDMMAFMQYAMQIISSFLMLSVMFIMIPRASVAAGRIAEVLNTNAEITDPTNPQKFNSTLKGVVEFKDVSFKYPGAQEDLLKNINFKALPGQTTAIIGSTGSGKSTLVNLIPRFYDVTKGQILVEGVDIREVSQYDLHNKIGYVPQKSSLFSGTIASNLKFANDIATEQEFEEAAEIAQAMEFIKDKEKGFLAEISQGGDNISGGQKQRLSIARALIKNPDIYIFDDSFSALDFKTAAALKEALRDKNQGSTFIVVAQRISTIMNAEQIIVLDQGRIVGKGTHKELIDNCETYQEIAYSQLSKEELA